jgi:hypothetical protein
VSPGNIRASVTVESHWAQNTPPPARFRDFICPPPLPFASIFERIRQRSKGAAHAQAVDIEAGPHPLILTVGGDFLIYKASRGG